ncbi:HEAT repeat domain-containing protein [Nocardiopsis terrae]
MPKDTPDHGPARRLLAETAPLTGPARMRHLARYAREHRAGPLLAETTAGLDALGQADLGAHMALAARDTGLVTGYLNGPDEDLRRSVLRRTPGLALPDRVLEELLDDAPHRLRRTLYTALYRDRRTEAADRLLPLVRERHGEHEAAVLLPACSTPAVDEHLDGLAHRVEGWSRLARRHPGPLLTRLERELDTAPDPELIWDRPWYAAALALEDHAPELLLPFLRGRPEPQAPRPPFAGARRLLYAPGDALHYPARYPAYAHGRRDVRGLLGAMARAEPRALVVLRVMRRTERDPVIERFLAEGGGTGAALLPYLGLLSPDRAAAEARRILDHLERARAVDPDHTHRDTEALAHLPFGEAEPLLTEAAGDPDPDRREHALYWLTVAAGRGGDADLARVLSGRLARSTADRDHVRRSLPLALGVLGPGLLGPEALPSLHRMLDDNLAAPDTTAETRQALGGLAVHVLHHPAGRGRADLADWALTVLARLIERHPSSGISAHAHFTGQYARWHRRPTTGRPWTPAEALTLEQARELYSRLAPALARHRSRGAHRSTVLLAQVLGRHLYGIPDLLDRDLGEVVAADPAASTAFEAARAHLRGPRPGERAERLFRATPAAVLITPVWERLARFRPALVGEALDTADRLRTRGGRLPGRSVRVRRGLTGTWLAAERSRAAEYLWDTAADPAEEYFARAEALRGLSGLPGALDLLSPWLDEGDPRLREAALVRIARAGEPERALGVLLDRVDEGAFSRAVVAVLGSCARRVRPSALLEKLGAVLAAPGRVSVRKTAARVLGQVRPPGAVGVLVGLLDQDRPHRDVRAAALGALMAHGDRPEVLAALEERRTAFTDPAARSALLSHPPSDLPPRLRPRAARLMLSLPASGDPAADEHAHVCRQVAGWALCDEELADGLVEDLFDLALPDERVLRTFEGLLRERRYADRLPDVVAGLVDLCPDPGEGVPPRVPEADRGPDPSRRVSRTVRMLAQRVRGRHDPEREVPGLDRAVRRLAAHPGLCAEALTLLLADLPVLTRPGHRGFPADLFGARVAAWAVPAARLPGLEPAAPRTAAETVLQGWGSEPDPRHLAALVRHLADLAARDTTPAGRTVGLVAVALAARRGEQRDWTGPWGGLVADLGRSPHGEVRVAAWRAAVL